MKKILLTILVVLLCILTYFMLADGFKVGPVQIFGARQIQEQNQKLDEEIATTSTKISSEYPQKKEQLKTVTSELLKAKQEYLDKTTAYTNEQILQATQENQYSIEFLLAQVGNHVTKEGVNIKMEIANGSTNGINDLNFTVNGTYVAITKFIAAIENDTNLNFRIKQFKLVPSSGEILAATFSVKNIRIIGNTSTQTINATPNSEETDSKTSTVSSSTNNSEMNTTNTEDTTNTTNTTNQ